MNEKEVMEIEQRFMANVFSKRPVVLTKGKGPLVWDINGKKYVDCIGGYGVCIVGHCHPKVVEAVKRQVDILISCHSSLYNDVRTAFLQRILEMVPRGLNKVLPVNSGAESVEAAIKLARRFTGKTDVIAMMGAFHGKTLGALSATWDRKYREPFLPLVPGFVHVPFGKAEKVEEAITDKTAAVIVEPIQGEGGVKVPHDEYLKELREICDDRDVLLIFDEVQTGFGRTGKMFACEHSRIVPDIMCLAKGLAGGLPMGLTVAREEVMSSLKVGEHSGTFFGSPLVCAAALATIDVISSEKLPERAATLGEYFMIKLEELKAKYNIAREVRGKGLMIGLEFRFDVYKMILKSIERGVLVLDAGRNVVRFLPPLVIDQTQIDEVVAVLDLVMKEEENERLSSASSYQND